MKVFTKIIRSGLTSAFKTLKNLTDTGIEQIFMDNTSGYTGLAKMKDTSNEPPLSLEKRPTPHDRTNIDHHLEKLEKPGGTVIGQISKRFW